MKFSFGTSMSTQVQSKRKIKDIFKLKMANYKVHEEQKYENKLLVILNGPKDSLYEGG